jgi:hypothetical protein
LPVYLFASLALLRLEYSMLISSSFYFWGVKWALRHATYVCLPLPDCQALSRSSLPPASFLPLGSSSDGLFCPLIVHAPSERTNSPDYAADHVLTLSDMYGTEAGGYRAVVVCFVFVVTFCFSQLPWCLVYSALPLLILHCPLLFSFFLFWPGLIFRFLLGYLRLSFIIHHYSRSRVWCYVYFIL